MGEALVVAGKDRDGSMRTGTYVWPCTMILYGESMSPFVRKVLAYVAEKGLEIELRPGREGAEFEETSPFRKMPGFRDPGAAADGGDFTISDSTAIVTYIEAKYPKPNLIPDEPAMRARTIWYDEFGDTIIFDCISPIVFNRIVLPLRKLAGKPAAPEKAEPQELPAILDYMERTIPASGYLVEDRLTLADLSVASHFANLRHLRISVDPIAYPRSAAYMETILARPSFRVWLERESAFLEHALPRK